MISAEPQNSLNNGVAVFFQSGQMYFQRWDIFLPDAPGMCGLKKPSGSHRFVLFCFSKSVSSPWEADAVPKCFWKALLAWLAQWHLRALWESWEGGSWFLRAPTLKYRAKLPDLRDSTTRPLVLQDYFKKHGKTFPSCGPASNLNKRNKSS